MKLLHLADLHLGRSIHQAGLKTQVEDHKKLLQDAVEGAGQMAL